MNICFVIDNSLTTSQVAYNGVTLLECAKNYVEKLVSSREAIIQTRHDTYHLFKTSSLLPLSSYQHQQLHFNSQLKMIVPEVMTDVAAVLREAFATCSRFRVASGCENVLGYTDPFCFQPSLVILLTDKSDMSQLLDLKRTEKGGKLLNRYDSQLHIVSLGIWSRLERPLNSEALKRQAQKSPNIQLMKQIVQSTGGSLRSVIRYEQGFEALDQLVNQFRPKFTMKMKLGELENSTRYFKDSGIKLSDVSPNSSSTLVLAYFQKHLGMRRTAKVPLPESCPIITQTLPAANNGMPSSTNSVIETIDAYSLPEFKVDFNMILDCPLNKQMPFDKLELEMSSGDISIIHEVCEKMKAQKNYYPVFCHDEAQRQLLIGILRITKMPQPLQSQQYEQFGMPKPSEPKFTMQLFYYLANFPELSQIMDVLLTPITQPSTNPNNSNNSNKRQNPVALRELSVEPMLAQYMRKIPVYYDRYVAKTLVEKGYSREVPIRPNPRLYINQRLQKYQYQQRKTAQEKYRINTKLHTEYQSECCYVYSDKYDEVAKGISKFKDKDVVTRTMAGTLQAVLDSKKRLGFVDVDDWIVDGRNKCVPVAKAQSYSFKAQANQNGRFLDYPSRKKRPILSNNTAEQSPKKVTIDFQSTKPPTKPPMVIQIESTEQALPPKTITPTKKQPERNTKLQIQKPAPAVNLTQQQKLVAEICSKFKAKKSKKLQLNTVNLVLNQPRASDITF